MDMILELNEVVIEGEEHTFSFLARSGRLTGLTGGTYEQRRRWLLTMMGFVPVRQGYVSIDGEPLTIQTSSAFRQLIAYAPDQLPTEGTAPAYKPPSVQDVFNLRANRHIAISNGILGEEMRRIASGLDTDDVRLLAVAALLDRPILLVSHPQACATDYLRQQAGREKIVVVATDSEQVLSACDTIVELN